MEKQVTIYLSSAVNSKRFLESPSFWAHCHLFQDLKNETNWINNSVQWSRVAFMLFEPECACIIGEIIGERVFCGGRCGFNPSVEHSIQFLSLPTKSVTNLVNVKIFVQMVRFNCKNWKDFKVPFGGVREMSKQQERIKSNDKSPNIDYMYILYL